MSARTLVVTIVATLLLIVGGTRAAHAEPLRISHTTWVGYGPLYVAQEKGFLPTKASMSN